MTTKIKMFDAVLYWLKLGFISFGGPVGQIIMVYQELVEKTVIEVLVRQLEKYLHEIDKTLNSIQKL